MLNVVKQCGPARRLAASVMFGSSFHLQQWREPAKQSSSAERQPSPAAFPIPPLAAGDYITHIRQYGKRLERGAWVGVGSVCKRNATPGQVAVVLAAIKSVRSDLRLHGFGLKTRSLRYEDVRARLYSADSMAWSYAARKQGRDPNSWREAKRFANEVAGMAVQRHFGWEPA